MPIVTQFLADHKTLLWVVLAIGIVSLLQVTIFYQQFKKFSHQLADSSFVRQPGGWPEWYIRFFKWSADSPVTRAFTFICGAICTVAALIGLIAL